MDQQINNNEHEFLWELLANPADFSPTHAYNLQELINEFPQSGVLRALLVAGGDEEAAKHAVAYFNPRTLYKVAKSPDGLPAVTDEQIIYEGKQLSEKNDETLIVEHDAIVSEPALQESEAVDTTDDTISSVEITDAGQENINNEPSDTSDQQEVNSAPAIDENPLAKEYEEHLAKTEEAERSEPVYTFDRDEYFHQDIDDEVYEEIVGIEDINLEQLSNYSNSAVEEKPTRETTDPVIDAEEDSVKESNYFVIDPSYVGGNKSQAESTQTTSAETFTKDVSKYNDEKMPYTFMWWLDKTRKEHAEIYQPYVVNNKPAVVPGVKKEIADELQQQYFENIFNVNSVDELDKSTSPKTDTALPQRKEDKIIERFIQQEPQIQHPSGIKLDNENKAKKSSEDRDELVTETLARIYTEQMLYHKAILTYKKLMLKFPEKSLYFAGHIEQLEKKIN